MIGLLQRVAAASIRVDGKIIAEISAGLLVFVGVRPTDAESDVSKLLARMLKYRVFADAGGRMNLRLLEVSGDLLLVPQFTLAADTRHGLRPGFSTAAPPERARQLFDLLIEEARKLHPRVESGAFGANMQVSLINDGPVTFWLEG